MWHDLIVIKINHAANTSVLDQVLSILTPQVSANVLHLLRADIVHVDNEDPLVLVKQ